MKLLVVLFLINLVSYLTQTVKFPSNIKISNDDLIRDFETFYIENFGSQLPFELQETEGDPRGEFGVFATKDLEEEHDLIKVPFNLMITAERILEASVIGEILDREDDYDLSQRDILSFYLSFSKFCAPEQNTWETWIALLPKKKIENVVAIETDDFKLLNGSHLYPKFITFHQKLIKSYKFIQELIQKYKQDFSELCEITFDQFKWATSITLSREFELIDSEDQPFLAIIPFIDFINHDKFEKPCYGYKSENRFFHIQSCKKYKKGDEILIPFPDAFSNGELFEKYGFILENNEKNLVEIPKEYLGVNPEDDLLDIKVTLIDKIRNSHKFYFFGGSISPTLFTAAKIINAEPNDLDENGLKPTISKLAILKLTEWFQVIVRYHLSLYPTTLFQDYEFLKNEDFQKWTEIRKNLFKIALSEKQILHAVGLHYAEKGKEIKKELDEQIKKNRQKDELL